MLRSAGGVSHGIEVAASQEGGAASCEEAAVCREGSAASSAGVTASREGGAAPSVVVPSAGASGQVAGLRAVSGEGVSGLPTAPIDGVPDYHPTANDPVRRDHLTGGAELHPQPTLADLDRLLDESRALGVAVSRHDEGEARPLTSTIERTAYRVIQEALTNAHKHASDTRIDVFVRYLPADLEVVVRNTAPSVSGRGRPDGGVPHGRCPGAGGGFPGSGWGLVGLRERVELVGGSLVAGPHVEEPVKEGSQPGELVCDEVGFQVLARIPAP
ncbi:sensor histidine kinase [Nonomuraea rhodomycinica]|uniref:sensor histidine kinase n=1 Tax=Nonomuraea rhodomycinica TaxID=1712872 RepID=UPI00406BC8B6